MNCDQCTATYPNRHDADCTRLADTEATMRAEARADRTARLIWKRDRVVDALAVFAVLCVAIYRDAPLPMWTTIVGATLLSVYVAATAVGAYRLARA